MRHLAGLVAGLGLLGACPAPESVPLELPGETIFAALLQPDPDGVWRGHGPFLWPEGQGLPSYARPDAPLRVVGWAAEAIEPLLPSEDISDARLEPALGCEPSLPAPAWAFEIQPDGARGAIDAGTLRLTAPWLRDRCPSIDGLGLLVHVSCRPGWCAARGVAGSGCDGTMELSACGLGPLPISSQPTGAICVAPAELAALGCEPLPSEAPVAAAARCTIGARRCEVELYHPAPAPFAQVRRRRLLPVEPFAPRSLSEDGTISARALLRAYAHDVEVLGDEILVAHGDGQLGGRCDASEQRRPSVLERVDPDELATVGTATAPPCLRRMLADGDAVLAVFAEEGDLWIGRFDRGGRRRVARPLDPRDPRQRPDDDPDRPLAEAVYVVELLRPTPGTLAVVLSTDDDGPRTLVFVVADDDLRPLRRRRLDGVTAMAAAATPEGIALASGRGVIWLDPASLADRAGPSVAPRPPWDDVTLSALHPHASELLAASVGEAPQVFAFGGGASELDAAEILELPAQNSLLAPWTEALVLVGAVGQVSPGRFGGLVARYDPRRRRVLPGLVEVGGGPIGRARLDGRGRAWLLLPWSAELVRLEPAGAIAGP